MKKLSIFIIITIFVSGCSNFSKEDLDGYWEEKFNTMYHEEIDDLHFDAENDKYHLISEAMTIDEGKFEIKGEKIILKSHRGKERQVILIKDNGKYLQFKDKKYKKFK
ncbi:hypothetical protein [Staphylococcus massiliensis]|uniref:Lipoprotein n=1 Tax=Staphylococcus massiliensis S46 TaxID=1229783 RepID=K9AWX5_9STAP|nr:hypothetical protein [Staphylococcus massiliensis]EKU47072.1 hypothetical protein C273_08186 [Staphylococcus massiliensis S46]MCG3398635.1 hypothetical protein [Staphylococcus massiliensis]MCG3413667.1 hypothetical protein [Staphylococcus massiliensis]POA00794.1 hypothetical protein CD133_03460 [Staphylococcus massiliensis CCUG 55927]